MEVDTGAAVSIIPEYQMTSHHPKAQIQPSVVVLQTYTGSDGWPSGGHCTVSERTQKKADVGGGETWRSVSFGLELATAFFVGLALVTMPDKCREWLSSLLQKYSSDELGTITLGVRQGQTKIL